MSDRTTIEHDSIRPLRRVEYERLVAEGLFGDERLELLRGALVLKSPQGSRHAWVVGVLNRALTKALSERADVRPQLPFAAAEDAEPEPDIAVVPLADYRDEHPARAHLIVEVADSTLRRDRDVKLAIYAESGVPEVWIVNLIDDRIEVYRGLADGVYGMRAYAFRGETLAPEAFPDVGIRVERVLP